MDRVLLLSAAVCAFTPECRAGDPIPKEVVVPIASIRSDDAEDRWRVVRRIRAVHYHASSAALGILDEAIKSERTSGKAGDDDARVIAIRVLESSNPSAAAAYRLMHFVDLEIEDLLETTETPPMSRFPAIRALAACRHEGARRCIWSLASKDHDEDTVRRLLWVVGAVYGRAVQFVLESEAKELETFSPNRSPAENRLDSAYGSRLRRVIRVYEEMHRTKRMPTGPQPSTPNPQP